MRKLLSVLFILFLFCIVGNAQQNLKSRVIFLGDAGEINQNQKDVISSAVHNIIQNKTTVVFLGDNIYPSGMRIDGERNYTKNTNILNSQFQYFRKNNVPVYFIPGNHDWDNSGPDGLDNIKNQWNYLNEKNDSLLKLIPENGCPDPVEISLSDSLVLITMDTEWWLFPYNKSNEGADCNCSTNRDVLNALAELLYKNRNKTILFATHHPFSSYGNHGGYFSWKDNLFPLTAINSSLYVPIPIVGSLYPILRRAFSNTEDLHNPTYEEMIRSVNNVFNMYPNMIHFSGHEHGLQLINDPQSKHLQVVSGSTAKSSYVRKSKKALFASSNFGYVIVDYYTNNKVELKFYTKDGSAINNSYSYTWDKYQPITELVDSAYNQLSGDSILIAPHKVYNEVGAFHRKFYGENYRKEWATDAKLPILRISDLYGGLKPEKLGGGYQSTSLRLISGDKKEYVLRTVEKSADMIVPDAFKGTFVKDILDDATSAQHPYSALIVPPIANALGVPHSNPTIGVVAYDKNLGMYNRLFFNRVALFEEREPLGNSDNYEKFMKQLQKDNDNTYDAYNFLKARMLDLLFGDWDRHGDQWRFKNLNKKKEDKNYIIVPRDRDMVLNITQGILPYFIKHHFVMPRVFGFGKNALYGSNYYFYKSAFLNAHPASQIPYDKWMSIATSFQNEVTDSVIKVALDRMPDEIANVRNAKLYSDLKARRDGIVEALDKYYKFSNSIVDIHLSDKNEFVRLVSDSSQDALHVTILKINKHGLLADTLADKIYPKKITKEIRLFLGKGDDSVFIQNNSTVKLRIVGGKGKKLYNVESSKYKVALYDRKKEHYIGETNKLKWHISKDSANLSFVPTNLYNTLVPMLNLAYNPDDGIFLGAGARITKQRGFRKSPYTSLHEISATHAFNTNAFNIKYHGEWIDVIGNSDFVLNAALRAPNNAQNFFGLGNETDYDKSIPNFKRYYRSRFTILDVNPSLRWNKSAKTFFSLGLTYQYYHLDPKDNAGRFILNTPQLYSNDSATVTDDKSYAGVQFVYSSDHRDNNILPSYGSNLYVESNFRTGLNKYSKDYVQIKPQFSVYKNLNSKRTIILADRFGGGVTLGNAPFYQSLFLGSQGDLLGFRQYRFAGQQAFYNNLELRIAISDFGNYILKGQFGITGFYDVGRVWKDHENSDKWHNSVGGGLYFAPAKLAVFRFNMGYTTEGWYPVFGMGMRF